MKRTIGLFLSALLATAFLAACAPAALTIKKAPHEEPDITTRAGFSFDEYKSILIIPPEFQRTLAPGQARTVVRGSGRTTKLISMIERILLSKGYKVISQDVIARVEHELADRKSDTSTGSLYTRSEKALVLGKETNAKAIMVLDSLRIDEKERCYVYNQTAGAEGFQLVTREDCALPQGAKGCVEKVKYPVLDFEGKLIDVKNGEVLWIGSAKVGALSMLPKDYTAFYADDCQRISDNFDLAFYVAPDSEFIEKQAEVTLKLILKDF